MSIRRTVFWGTSMLFLVAGALGRPANAQGVTLPNPLTSQPACTSFVSPSGSDAVGHTGSSRGTGAFLTIQHAYNYLVQTTLNNAPPTRAYAICIQDGTYTSDDYAKAIQNAVTQQYPGSKDDVLLITSSGGTATYPIWIMGDPQNTGGYPTLTQTGKYGIEFGPGAHDIVIAYLNVYGQALNSNVPNASPALATRTSANSAYWPFYDGNCIGGQGNYVNNSSYAQIKTQVAYDITIYNTGAYQCGGGGLGFVLDDHITLLNNQVMQNGYWSIYYTSGISALNSVDVDNGTGYKTIVANNLVFGNQEKIPNPTDGEGIIIDTNINSNVPGGITIHNGLGALVSPPPYGGRTLVANNVAVANGGPGIEVYHSINVDLFSNSTYLNSTTTRLVAEGELFVNYSDYINVYNSMLESSTGVQPMTGNKYSGNSDYSGNNVNAGNNDIYMNGGGSTFIPTFINSHSTLASNPTYENPDPAGAPWNINLSVLAGSGPSGLGCDNSGVLCNTTTTDIQGNVRSGSYYPVGAYFKTHN